MMLNNKFYLLLIIFMILFYNIESFQITRSSHNNIQIVRSSHNNVIRKYKFQLNVFDQIQDTNSILQDSTNAFVDGFERSFFGTMFSRVLGGIVGNIVAGIALTTITVSLSKTWNKEKENKEKENNYNKNVNFDENTSKFKTKSIPVEAWGKLIICIGIDFLGDASYVIPGIGELEDVAWAPLSAFLLSKLFNNNVLTSFEFVKEILPGTDVIPVATLSWFLEYVFPESFLSNSLKLNKK